MLNILPISQWVNNILFSFSKGIISTVFKFGFKPLTLISFIFTNKYTIKVKAFFA